ncbi:MAG: outer membrane beta-barrel protein [Bacteroidia bacterium]
MKKINLKFYALFIGGVLFNQLNAQTWSIAPTLGTNFSTVSVTNKGVAKDDYGYRMGFAIGATAEYKYKPRIYFRPAANLASSRGHQRSVYSEPIKTTFDDEASITFFDLIGDCKYTFGQKEQFFALGGLYFGYALSGTNTTTKTSETETETKTEAITFGSASDQRASYDLGLGLGFGYRFDINKKPLEITAKYNLGLVNQVNDADFIMKQRFVSIGISYFLFNTKNTSNKSGDSPAKPKNQKGTKDEEL